MGAISSRCCYASDAASEEVGSQRLPHEADWQARDGQGNADSWTDKGNRRSVTIGKVLTTRAEYGLDPMQFVDGMKVQLYNVNLHGRNDEVRNNLELYYNMCKSQQLLHVTTSCFSVWRKSKKTNSSAKVIPATTFADELDAVRVFFFDDNLEFEGKERSSGICNLRDVTTGEFVDFGEGNNGFTRSLAAKHTMIYSSSMYRTVLVKANILDAMENTAYFSEIIKEYSDPGERVLVYMDVNSTIVCNDSVQGKDAAASLLGTMFECIEFHPAGRMELEWKSYAKVSIDKPKTLKSLVKDMTADKDSYATFWSEETCFSFVADLLSKGAVTWVGDSAGVTVESFRKSFQEYLTTIADATDKEGIVKSWYQVYTDLTTGHLSPKDGSQHVIFLNSFGVDTRRVVTSTVADESHVIQVTVNFELWEERDVKKFQAQFEKQESKDCKD
eukprot:TRINITY_DN7530_c0_g1_i1.p1 TRINITY_DN7530_c0_g1~~TRINITY_DN7530_c0_g1_i1.p1  ORF type:complete len:472 (-),score=75.17 TRINITY_DN7530_c0_g1_i1:48-1379(-)